MLTILSRPFALFRPGGWRIVFCFTLASSLVSCPLQAQVTAGRIMYERKTNLYKKYKEHDVSDWIRKEDRIKVDTFNLFFNDTFSVFKPHESDLKENMSWATSKNSVYQNFSTGQCFTVKQIWGEKLYVSDTLRKRTWKITNGQRTICGYKCRKAMWQVNDSTRIYAWYTDEIMVSTGPESFYGLPGAILGLATEDGGVIYFARLVEKAPPPPVVFELPKYKKLYSSAELRTKLEKDFGKQPWGKEMIKEAFDVW